MNTSQREHSLLATLIDIHTLSADKSVSDPDARQRIGAMADAAIKNIAKVPDKRTVVLVPETHRVVPYCPTQDQLAAALGQDFEEGEDLLLTEDYKAMIDAAPAVPVLE
jgi:hypothetical protein